MDTYRIVRFYEDNNRAREVITRGLTLEQAKAHCQDPETSSTTATSEAAQERTANFGRWFDGFEKEN